MRLAPVRARGTLWCERSAVTDASDTQFCPARTPSWRAEQRGVPGVVHPQDGDRPVVLIWGRSGACKIEGVAVQGPQILRRVRGARGRDVAPICEERRVECPAARRCARCAPQVSQRPRIDRGPARPRRRCMSDVFSTTVTHLDMVVSEQAELQIERRDGRSAVPAELPPRRSLPASRRSARQRLKWQARQRPARGRRSAQAPARAPRASAMRPPCQRARSPAPAATSPPPLRALARPCARRRLAVSSNVCKARLCLLAAVVTHRK